MNPLNYASIEASKKLHDAGIVLETEAVWYVNGAGWQLSSADWVYNVVSVKYEVVPAPSMAEVWRELPRMFKGGDFECGKTIDNQAFAGYYIPADYIDDFGTEVVTFRNTNPTDALIELLIWVRREKP